MVDIDSQGRMRKLLRVTARVLRFVENLKPGGAKRKGGLSRDELIIAEKEWVRAAQLDLKSQKTYANLKGVLVLKKPMVFLDVVEDKRIRIWRWKRRSQLFCLEITVSRPKQ